MRKFFQEGRLRITLGILTFLVVGFLLLWGEKLTWIDSKKLGEGLQKTAFVAGAFCVTAYNLRVRVLDLILKIEDPLRKVKAFSEIALECSKKLTNLVLLFTLSALTMGLAGCFEKSILGSIVTALAGATFASSVLQFVYVVFAFEIIEKKAIQIKLEQASEVEVKRLTEPDYDRK